MLASRDARAAHQKELLGQHPGCSLVCLTVQLPGAEKRNALSQVIAQAGVAAVREIFRPEYEELRDLPTGFEGYFLVAMAAVETKRRACQIEASHPLGRLMDIDVPGIGREEIGLPPRRCLLCDNEVRYCMRAKTHTQEELLQKIKQMVNDYEQGIQTA